MASISLIAQTDIISAKELKDLMKSNQELVVVHAGKSKAYNQNHIKGAIRIHHMDMYQKENDVSGLLKSPEELAAFFGELGISENSEVVIYDNGSQKYNTRIYWTLKYLGAKNVKMLHNDMGEWGKVRLPLTTAATELKPVTFTPTVDPTILADLEYVKNNKDNDNVVLIDARTVEEYTGEDEKSDGHIPGAINVNYELFLTDDGAFKSEEDIRALVTELGITPEMEVIAYCKTSVRAAPVFVAFKNILGFENVKVYDGAYNEWTVDNTLEQ